MHSLNVSVRHFLLQLISKPGCLHKEREVKRLSKRVKMKKIMEHFQVVQFKDFKVSTMHEGKRLLDIFLVLYVLAVLCPGGDG